MIVKRNGITIEVEHYSYDCCMLRVEGDELVTDSGYVISDEVAELLKQFFKDWKDE